jgi:DNA-binding transcriptional regulator PaaX
MSCAQQMQPISAAAERMRRTRERRRDGMWFVGIDVRTAEVEELVRRGLLAEAERADPAAIAKAVNKLLDSMLAA